MQYIQVDIWPAGLTLGIAVSLIVLMHASTRLARRAVTRRTRAALQRAIESMEE